MDPFEENNTMVVYERARPVMTRSTDAYLDKRAITSTLLQNKSYQLSCRCLEWLPKSTKARITSAEIEALLAINAI